MTIIIIIIIKCNFFCPDIFCYTWKDKIEQVILNALLIGNDNQHDDGRTTICSIVQARDMRQIFE